MSNSLIAELCSYVVSNNDALTLLASGVILKSVDIGAGQVSVVLHEGKRSLVFQTASEKSFVLPVEASSKLV
jgi:hypothetical protein